LNPPDGGRPELLLATGNAKKQVELRHLLAALDVRLLTPEDVGGLPEVDEDQPTFGGNAAKKALSAAHHTGRWALADDSGLEVDHLAGAPGVRSARYAGSPCDDAANNEKLLLELAGVPEAERGARFVCALALARPDGTLATELEGEALGRILCSPRGERDFGYDPLFLFTEEGFAETGRGFAELAPEAKSRVSHRGRALARLIEVIGSLIEARA
jgi:XTP/dITP diphosphohydrolase